MTTQNTTPKATATILNDQDLAPVSGGLELPIAPVGAVDTTLEPQSPLETERQLINQIANPMNPGQTER